MLNKFSSVKINKELVFSIFIVVLFLISSGVAINQNSAPNQKTTTSLNNQVNSALISALTKSSASSSDQPAVLNSGSLRNVIFTYSNQNEKNAILSYVAKNGQLIDTLQYLPFVLAKIPLSKYNYLSGLTSKIYLDKVFQAFPKNIMKDAVTSAVNASYKAPIHQINGDSLISQGYKGQNITIAVIDTGIDSTHPDLQGKILYNTSYVLTKYGYSSDESSADLNGHGTHVAALAAGTGAASNGKYIGVAPDAKLYNLKVGSMLGSATTSAILEAVNEAINLHANIITTSLGSSGSGPNDPLSLAYDIAVNKYGIVATVSAGNSGPAMGTIATPGNARSVITVGASYWENNTATFFSSRGPDSDHRYDPDVLAPGWEEVSALASNSITDLAQQYYTPSGIIPGNGGNYIAFSGTSMAAPVTAGAVALLLSKYPDLTPQAVRAALMSSATNTGQPEYVQGAGFLNLANADSLLSSTYTAGSKNVNVVSLLPQRSIYPNEPVLYPGQNLKVNLQFVAGEQFPISLSFANSTLESMISYNKSVTSLTHEQSAYYNGGYYGELMLTFQVPLNPKPGNYTGSVVVSIGTHNYTLAIGPITVDVPTNQIAWNIWYNTDGQDTPTGNYAAISSYLETKSIHMSVVNQPVSASWLYKYNAVIFPDNELAISNSQINVLKDYIQNGGKVVLISSFYPFSEIANYNQLSSSYGITLGHTPAINITDLGFTEVPQLVQEPMSLHSFDSVPFSQIGNFSWYGGTLMSVSGSASQIGSLTNGSTVMAGFAGNSTVKGQLFVFGSEYWFYNGLFASPEQTFAQEFFTYLVNETQPFINVASNQQEVKVGQPWNGTVFVGKGSNFNAEANANVALLYPNGTSFLLNGTQSADQKGGSISFVPSSAGQYTLTVQYDNKVLNTTILAYDQSIGFNLTVIPSQHATSTPSFLADTGIAIVDQGTNLLLNLDLNQTLPTGTTASVEITLVPEILQGVNGFVQTITPLYSTQLALTGSGKHYQASLQTTTAMNVGFYITELIISDAQGNFTGQFFNDYYLSTPDPTISASQSTVDGKVLSTYDTSGTQTPTILKIQPSQTVSFSIQAQKIDGPGSAFIMFVPYYPFLDTQTIIQVWQLNQTQTGVFQGSITLPSVTSLPDNGQELNFGNNLITAFLIILRDKNGNMDIYPVITQMNSAPIIDNNLLLFFFVVLPGIIVIGYYIKSRNKRRNNNYNYNFRNYQYNNQMQNQNPYQGYPPPYQPNQPVQPQDEIRFCPYCGSSLTPGSNFCMECGKKIK